MVLTAGERQGVADLLARMEPADLLALAQTVTSRLLVASTPAEAVDTIILHTDKVARHTVLLQLSFPGDRFAET